MEEFRFPTIGNYSSLGQKIDHRFHYKTSSYLKNICKD